MCGTPNDEPLVIFSHFALLVPWNNTLDGALKQISVMQCWKVAPIVSLLKVKIVTALTFTIFIVLNFMNEIGVTNRTILPSEMIWTNRFQIKRTPIINWNLHRNAQISIIKPDLKIVSFIWIKLKFRFFVYFLLRSKNLSEISFIPFIKNNKLNFLLIEHLNFLLSS